MSNRHFLRDDDLSSAEQLQILALAKRISEDRQFAANTLSGRVIGLMFQKPSLRTRVSTEVACASLGAYPLQLRHDELHLKRGESYAEAAEMLGSYISMLVARVEDHRTLEQLAESGSLPIVNGLSDKFHPLQGLADLLTLVQEWRLSADLRGFSGKRLVYLGDGNNVANSLLLASAMAGLNITVVSPPKYQPKDVVVKQALGLARSTGAKIQVTDDVNGAVAGADALYTDVWTSMGSEGEEQERMDALRPYQLNEGILAKAKADAVVLHCLPAHRGEEIVSAVLDGKNSRVKRQAFNRLPTVAAIMLFLLRPELAVEMAEFKVT